MVGEPNTEAGTSSDSRAGLPTSLPSIVIVDDHLVLAESLASELLRRRIATSVIIHPTAADGLGRFVESRADGALIDLDLGEHEAGGLRYLREAVSIGMTAAIFTGSDDEVQLGRCLEEGAAGIVLKSQPFAEVAERVRRLLDNEPVNSDTELLRWVLAAQNFRRQRAKKLAAFEQLTARERVVLQHVIDGLRASAIAEIDHVSVATVRSQVRAVLQKLGVHSQIEAVALARKAQWSQTSPGSAG